MFHSANSLIYQRSVPTRYLSHSQTPERPIPLQDLKNRINKAKELHSNLMLKSWEEICQVALLKPRLKLAADARPESKKMASEECKRQLITYAQRISDDLATRPDYAPLSAVLDRVIEADFTNAFKGFKNILDGDNGDINDTIEPRAIAALFLGIAYLEGLSEGGASEGLTLLRQARKAGVKAASGYLGMLSIKGDHVTRNLPEGVSLLKEAAESGDPSALYSLATLYLGGEGVDQDTQEALRCFLRAADSGHSLANLILANFYENGTYVSEDKELAFDYYTAVNEEFGKLFLFKEAVAMEENGDAEGAMRTLRNLASTEFGPAIERLASFIISRAEKEAAGKIGTRPASMKEEDRKALSRAESGWKEAFNCLASAVEKGDGKACITVGWLQWTGRGMPPDLRAATRSFVTAHSAGNKRASFITATILASIPGRFKEAESGFVEAASELPVASFALGTLKNLMSSISRRRIQEIQRLLPDQKDKEQMQLLKEQLKALIDEERNLRKEAWSLFALALKERVAPAISFISSLQSQAKGRGDQPIAIQTSKRVEEEGSSWFLSLGEIQARLVAIGDSGDSELYDLITSDDRVADLHQFCLDQREKLEVTEKPNTKQRSKGNQCTIL
jgi:TPR repeat protein